MKNKIKMHTQDMTVGNVAKIATLFPQCVTERLNKDGKPELAIDFDKLRAELSNEVLDEGEERYQFTWPDKRAASRLANTPSDMTLRPCKEESAGKDGTPGSFDSENLYIEGDNLEVLKLLREDYLGKVKMIYIDPPYNTGNDFVYKDNYGKGKGEFEETSGFRDEEGNQTTDPMQRNTEANGRFHTDWLNMIYPRLKVARDLLSDDGVIFISIDDGEVENLKKICNEIFGEQNFITQFIWEKTQHFGRQKLNNYSNCDYILAFSKELFHNKLKELLVERVNDNLLDAPLFNASNNINSLDFPKHTVKFNIKDGVYQKTQSDDYELSTPVVIKNGWNDTDFTLKFRSRWSNQTVQNEIKKGTTFWIKTGKFAIRAIYNDEKTSNVAPNQFIFTNTNNPMYTRNRFGYRVDTSENASALLENLMNSSIFSYPKPSSLIEYLISLLYNKGAYDRQALILDFFSGSATTAHAVMKLNAEDGGNRKFIMVQLPEVTDEKSGAYKAGYNTICEIGKERIRRAGKKIKEENAGKEGIDKLDIGFRVLKLDSSNMEDVFYTPEAFKPDQLKLFVDNVKPDRTPLDLLFQVMPELNIELSAKVEEREVNGKKVFFVDGNYLIATFDKEVNESTVTEIAKLKPQYFVMRDASAANDNVLDNFEQIFRHYSPDTTRKIL